MRKAPKVASPPWPSDTTKRGLGRNPKLSRDLAHPQSGISFGQVEAGPRVKADYRRNGRIRAKFASKMLKLRLIRE